MTNLATQPFDYTARDFVTLRADIERRVREAIPEWEPNPAAFEATLLDMFAYVGDILNFYIDRMSAEAYVQTATQRESVIALAQMFGYVPSAQTAARGNVVFSRVTGLTGDIEVPAGTQIYAQRPGEAPIIFETVNDHVIEGPSESIEVAEGTTVRLEALGASTGTERQAYPLFNRNVIKDSIVVYTQDGPPDIDGNPTLVEWHPVNRMIDASFFERVYVVYTDENGFSHVVFGDGVSGSIPTTGAPILATYRYGFGTLGNIGPGTATSLVSGSELAQKIASVHNPDPFTGGADVESLESMRRNVPRSLRALERAVTLEDYAAITLQVPGIVKARANAVESTAVTVYAAPAGGGQPSAALLEDVEEYVTQRSMFGTTVTAVAPTYVNIHIHVNLTVHSRYRRTVVAKAVENAIKAGLSFDSMQFGQVISKATTFRAASDIPGVEFFDITAHNRTGTGNFDTIALAPNEIAVPGNISVTAVGGILPL